LKIRKKHFAEMIDHTQLKPNTTKEDIIKLCSEAKIHGFGCVCVNSFFVPLAVQQLQRTKVRVCSTVGFPLGSALTEVKVFETKKVIEMGALEVDMVINIGAMKSKDHNIVKNEVEMVVKEAHSQKNIITKFIIETAYLTKEEKIEACKIIKNAKADFIKTSTGLVEGANVKDIILMRSVVGQDLGVKAAGGIRTLEDAILMIKAGANRIGTSSGVRIMNEFSTIID
jgi:deoxyribose-phosphate aldolase